MGKPNDGGWVYKQVLQHMGVKVVVYAVMKRDESGCLYTWKGHACEPRAGWLVGCRWLKDGTYIPRGDGANDSPYLKVSRTVFAPVVVWWPTQVAVPVSALDMRLWRPEDPEPYTSAGYGDGDERRRNIEWQRAHHHEWARDAKGRFAVER